MATVREIVQEAGVTYVRIWYTKGLAVGKNVLYVS